MYSYNKLDALTFSKIIISYKTVDIIIYHINFSVVK